MVTHLQLRMCPRDNCSCHVPTTLTPGPHWMHVCVAEPPAPHLGAHANRSEKPQSLHETRVSHEAAVSLHLQIQGLAYFLCVTHAVLSRKLTGKSRRKDRTASGRSAAAGTLPVWTLQACETQQFSDAHALLRFTHPVCPRRNAWMRGQRMCVCVGQCGRSNLLTWVPK